MCFLELLVVEVSIESEDLESLDLLVPAIGGDEVFYLLTVLDIHWMLGLVVVLLYVHLLVMDYCDRVVLSPLLKWKISFIYYYYTLAIHTSTLFSKDKFFYFFTFYQSIYLFIYWSFINYGVIKLNYNFIFISFLFYFIFLYFISSISYTANLLNIFRQNNFINSHILHQLSHFYYHLFIVSLSWHKKHKIVSSSFSNCFKSPNSSISTSKTNKTWTPFLI